MRIPLYCGAVFHPGSPDEDDARALQCLMECLIEINLIYLKRYRTPQIEQSGLKYVRTEEWDSIPDLLNKGFGDCKSLTAFDVAQIRNSGNNAKPVFRMAVNPTNARKEFHILTQTGSGFRDMSKFFGMHQYNAQRGLWTMPEA